MACVVTQLKTDVHINALTRAPNSGTKSERRAVSYLKQLYF
jgi:hypothetical protein